MAYTYARRNELAREKGFDSYSHYRRVTEFADESNLFSQESGVEDPRNDLALAKLFYQAFHEGDPDDYSVQLRKGQVVVKIVDGVPTGAKAKLFIDYFGYVADAEAWAALYPTNTRFGHLLTSGTVMAKPKRGQRKGVRAKKLSTMRRTATGGDTSVGYKRGGKR